MNPKQAEITALAFEAVAKETAKAVQADMRIPRGCRCLDTIRPRDLDVAIVAGRRRLRHRHCGGLL
jgi:hypothetical protein